MLRTARYFVSAGLACWCACSASSETAGDDDASGATVAPSGAGGDDSGSGGSGATGLSGGTFASTGAGGAKAREGCTAVDILFVIDDSVSMGKYQEQLAVTFPSFVDAIVDNLPEDTDLHVGMTTSSFTDKGGGSPGEIDCKSTGTIADFEPYYDTPDELDNGENGAQGRLYEHAGKRFFEASTSDDPAALKSWFTEAAVSIGEYGSVWEMVSAGGAYVAHPANAAFNAGFIRDEGAVLVVFFLSDEVDNSIESVETYHDMLVASKPKCGGDACIITGGIIMPCITMTPGNTLWGLMSSFGETPPYADIDGSSSDYTGALGGALAQVIAATCDEIGEPK